MASPRAPRDFGLIKSADSPHAKLKSVDLRSVRWTHGFWAERFAQCRDVTLPHLWQRLNDPETGHALTNLRIAAGLEEGEFAGTHWQDEWVYKWLEAASSIYNITRDEALDRQMDEAIDVIAKAQQPDGYIATQVLVRGWPRFQDPRHHELYVMGHLITAACLHHRITGKDALLAVARKAADCVYETFKGRDPALAHFPINPSIIMAAAELYRTTGERRCLDLACLFVDMRGAVKGGTDLNQDAVPLRDETQVVGHAVFFTYLYAGAADVYMETGERALLDALERLWHDLTGKRMYVTGGVCALHRGFSIRSGQVWSAHDVHEAAGPDCHLPNATAYNETCAQIGSMMWNWRMLAITADACYPDLMERQLYNSILSGIGLDGRSWFYTNVLRWHGREHPLLSQDDYQRFQPGEPPRRSHICCPSNLLRTVAEAHGTLYSASDDGLWVHHYAANAFDGELLDGTPLRLTQETNYPWEGDILLRLELTEPHEFSLMLRIPGWATGARLEVNGEAADAATEPGTYAGIRRTWSAGDEVRLTLPMAPRLIEGNPKIEEVRSQVAVMRGPLVYCLESPDLPGGVALSEIRIPRDIAFTARHEPELLGGVTVLEGTARRVREGDWARQLYRPLDTGDGEPVRLKLIPYFAWANRGISEMTVWMPLC